MDAAKALGLAILDTLKDNRRVLFAIAMAVDAYLLTQPDVPVSPAAKVLLGIIAVTLAVLDPKPDHSPT